jgi:hypothetical protein
MAGYQKFHGDTEGMQSKYYAFANWFFTTPFMAIMRDMAVKYNQNLLPYPVFGLVYGQSKAGKTTFFRHGTKFASIYRPPIARHRERQSP